jgi:hypothetical protein
MSLTTRNRAVESQATEVALGQTRAQRREGMARRISVLEEELAR